MAIVRQPDGARLVAFLAPADGPPPNVRVTGTVAVVRHGDRVLLVLDRGRGSWELPGGGIEPVETPEACARRETLEESGQTPGPLSLRGWAIWFAPGMGTGRSECCAVFAGTVDREVPFALTAEIGGVAWCAPGEEPAGMALIDRALLSLATR
ncbi:MAG: NUDIX domain-containing protein [Candidatus Coatesbacteria bacterium]